MTLKTELALGLCLLAACVAGCSRFGRISECRDLAETVNGHMAELETIAQGKDTPETFAKMARGYAKLADEVAALPVAKGAASATVTEYVSQLRSAASSSREVSAALKHGARTEIPRRELDRLSRKDKLSAQKLDTYCHAP
jgi:hypothetical protein